MGKRSSFIKFKKVVLLFFFCRGNRVGVGRIRKKITLILKLRIKNLRFFKIFFLVGGLSARGGVAVWI